MRTEFVINQRRGKCISVKTKSEWNLNNQEGKLDFLLLTCLSTAYLLKEISYWNLGQFQRFRVEFLKMDDSKVCQCWIMAGGTFSAKLFRTSFKRLTV